MKLSTLAVAAAFVCSVAGSANAAGDPKAAKPAEKPAAAAAAPMMEMPKPGPEHEVLKNDVGTWNANVEVFMAPGAPPMTSKGVETNTLMGGFWLIQDFKGDFGGMPFQGHGTAGYDPAKKKYVSTWIDSMTPSLGVGEATYDAASKTLTGSMDGVGMDGKPLKSKMVSKWPDANTRVFEMYNPGPEGKEALAMRITYTRQK